MSRVRNVLIVLTAAFPLIFTACSQTPRTVSSQHRAPASTPKATDTPHRTSSPTTGRRPLGSTARMRPSDFATQVDNPWFPLRPGVTLSYQGSDGGKPTRETFVITGERRQIQGVSCVVIHDNVYQQGHLAERTTDWYAADKDGNVWYFGEATAELDRNGHVTTTEGSWQAGRDGAAAGVFMPAQPRVGQSFRQEYLAGHAEDHFSVQRVGTTVKVPAMSDASALVTKEWTPLEPGIVDQKYYVRGIGTVLERSVKGHQETNELVSVKRS